MNNLDIYINFIIFIKICFIISAITHGYLKRSKKAGSDLDEKSLYWKEKLEFIFKALMAGLIIYLFNPRHSREKILDYETKVLLYLFGFILLLTANWSTFVEESTWFEKLQNIIGENSNTI
jgi:hypothetical protein